MAGETPSIAKQSIDPGVLYTPAEAVIPATLAKPAPLGQSPADAYTEVSEGSVPFSWYWDFYTNADPLKRGIAGAFLPVMGPATVAVGFLSSPLGCANQPSHNTNPHADEGEDSGRPPQADGSTHQDHGLVGPDGRPPAADGGPDATTPDAGDDDAGTDGGTDGGGPDVIPDGGDDDGGPDVVDADGDGHTADVDCDDSDNTVFQNLTGFIDGDGDGFTVGPERTLCVGAALPEGMALLSLGDDCNDSNASINPGIPETPYDGIDQDCNGADLTDVDGDAVSLPDDCDDNDRTAFQNLTGYQDTDGDGRTVGELQTLCTGLSLPEGYTEIRSTEPDCDDTTDALYQNLTGYIDADGDGYTMGAPRTLCSGAALAAGLSFTSAGADCDETNSSLYQYRTGFQDADGDGYTLAAEQTVCSGAELPAGFVSAASSEPDCNDDQNYIHPGASQRLTSADNDTNCDGTPDMDIPRDAVTIVGQNDGDLAGYAMVGANMNGDAYPDVIVGSPGFNSSFGEGKVDIIFGGPDTLVSGALFSLGTDQNVSISGACGWGLGESVQAIDLNGDGIDDLIIGASSYNGGYCGGTRGDGDGSMTGAELIVYGRENWEATYNFYDIDSTNAVVLSALQMALIKGDPGEGLGQHLLNTGDINGDGRDELIVGGGNGNTCDAIPAIAYAGIRNKSEIMLTEGGIHFHDYVGSQACFNIASGDINGDGLADPVLADNYDLFHDGAGHVTALRGSLTFPSDVNLSALESYPDLGYVIFYGGERGDEAGSPVAVGDMDRDGKAELLIGVPRESGGKLYKVPGAAITAVMNGTNPTFPNGSHVRLDGPVVTLGGSIIFGDRANAGFSAYGLTLQSDTNGDGCMDPVVGAWTYAGGTEGRVYHYNAASISAATSSEISSDTADNIIIGAEGTHLGLKAVGGVDFDGDGTGDVMLNAIGSTGVPAGPGRVYIFSGGSR